MATKAPNKGERLICQRDDVGLFATANLKAEQLKINTIKERELRGFRKGETVGYVLDENPVIGADGTTWFLKIQYVLFGFQKTGFFGEGFFAPEFHQAYVNLSDEPDGWIRESWKPANEERQQQQTIDEVVEAYFSGLSGIPKPTAVYEKDVDGHKAVWLDFANGYTVEFEKFKLLSSATKVTNTTRNPDKTLDGLTGPNAPKPKSTLFTTTNILIGVFILAVFGLLIAQTISRKRR